MHTGEISPQCEPPDVVLDDLAEWNVFHRMNTGKISPQCEVFGGLKGYFLLQNEVSGVSLELMMTWSLRHIADCAEVWISYLLSVSKWTDRCKKS